MAKHREVNEMISNIESVSADDVARYAIFSGDNDREKSRNIEDLINSMLNNEKNILLKNYQPL